MCGKRQQTPSTMCTTELTRYHERGAYLGGVKGGDVGGGDLRIGGGGMNVRSVKAIARDFVLVWAVFRTILHLPEFEQPIYTFPASVSKFKELAILHLLDMVDEMGELSIEFLNMGGFKLHLLGDEARGTERSSLGQVLPKDTRGVCSEPWMGNFRENRLWKDWDK
ncbi:hypothetical protein GW17_00027169 [Ensete ventricosum]|nr:hypothetical protein GW17_00027169 [Ensete ventricosum]RZR86540.1 hypothetical protein BHM03_00013751 [Ensete ventricosum]